MKAIFIIAISLLSITSFAQSSNPAPPVWPNQFQQAFTETFTYPVIGSSNTTGNYYYDWTNQRYRVDRENGKWDRYCGSVEKFSDTPCSHIVVDGNRYLWFPQENYCCFCCDSEQGCGVLQPTWLQSAIFIGYNTTSDGEEIIIWDIKGLQDNYYYALNGTNGVLIPYEINQVPNDIQYFNPATYVEDIVDPSIFNLPSSQCNVNNTCPILSTCTAVRSSLSSF